MLRYSAVPNYIDRYPNCYHAQINLMVTTAQVLAERAMQLPCDEQCVDWAIRLQESGHETAATSQLAAKLRPHSHFELAALRDRILVELDAADTTFDSAVCAYVAEMLADSNTRLCF